MRGQARSSRARLGDSSVGSSLTTGPAPSPGQRDDLDLDEGIENVLERPVRPTAVDDGKNATRYSCSDLISRYSSSPNLPSSRPWPDCLKPPKGANGLIIDTIIIQAKDKFKDPFCTIAGNVINWKEIKNNLIESKKNIRATA